MKYFNSDYSGRGASSRISYRQHDRDRDQHQRQSVLDYRLFSRTRKHIENRLGFDFKLSLSSKFNSFHFIKWWNLSRFLKKINNNNEQFMYLFNLLLVWILFDHFFYLWPSITGTNTVKRLADQTAEAAAFCFDMIGKE